MIPALPNLQVRSIRQRQPHAQQHLVHRERRYVNLFDSKIFAAVEHSRGHSGRHYQLFLEKRFFQSKLGLLCGRCFHLCVIRIFRDSSVGCAASSQPSWILSKGNLCVTISITGSFFPSTSPAALPWMSTAAL